MKVFSLWLLLLLAHESRSQTWFTRNGIVSFFSKTPLENIRAENQQVYALIDGAKQNIALTMLVKAFLFQKDLMQQHFNEDYMESDKYPKASFVGSYNGAVNWNKDGSYPVLVQGRLTLHGVARDVSVPANFTVQGNRLSGTANFKVSPADYNIQVPSLVSEKIAKQLDVSVTLECTPK